MSLLRPFKATDLFNFNHVNLDAFTETYSISYYMNNLSQWPDQFCAVEDTRGTLMGYSEHSGSHTLASELYSPLLFPVMGKTEGRGEDWQ
jgi:N-terminal acetyltransferase B complex catalytic subunit